MNTKPKEKIILHVLVKNNDGSFFGQGLELDYVAEGESFMDLQDRFVNGLLATIKMNVKNKTVSSFLTNIASGYDWLNFYNTNYKSLHSIPIKHQYLPFRSIDFKLVSK
jgi:hypothetical protein